jgi:hypothetical protein
MRKVKLGWYVWMLRSEGKSQPQDPGSKSEPGAPSALLWFVRVGKPPVVAVHCLGHPPHPSDNNPNPKTQVQKANLEHPPRYFGL